MDSSDMGLPDDEFRKELSKLALQRFDFADLLVALTRRQERLDEIASEIDKHDRGPFKGVTLPPIEVSLEDLLELLKRLKEEQAADPTGALCLAIRLTESVRQSQSQEAQDNLKDFLSAIKASSDGDLTVRLVMEVCERELG